jgi:hypothetical protein
LQSAEHFLFSFCGSNFRAFKTSTIKLVTQAGKSERAERQIDALKSARLVCGSDLGPPTTALVFPSLNRFPFVIVFINAIHQSYQSYFVASSETCKRGLLGANCFEIDFRNMCRTVSSGPVHSVISFAACLWTSQTLTGFTMWPCKRQWIAFIGS